MPSAAEQKTPPKAGLINVLALTANTASAASDTDHPASAGGQRYLSVICTEVFYVLFTSNGKNDATSLPDPVIATTGVGATVDGRCWGPLAANTTHDFEVGGDDRYFKLISASNATARWYLSSRQEG
jgi:hypothetical protein